MLKFDNIPEALNYIFGDAILTDKIYKGHKETPSSDGITTIEIIGTKLYLYKVGNIIFLDDYTANNYLNNGEEYIVDELY